jgi:nitrogen fixation/metabolism regulation signal transduction histidine kinase
VLDLLARAQKAQSDLVRLYEGAREYAAPLRLDCRRADLGVLWREAWEEVGATQTEREAQLSERVANADLVCEVDAFRLSQIFRNILENAFGGMPRAGQDHHICSVAMLSNQPALRIGVRDNGRGLDTQQRQRLLSPSTRPRRAAPAWV